MEFLTSPEEWDSEVRRASQAPVTSLFELRQQVNDAIADEIGCPAQKLGTCGLLAGDVIRCTVGSEEDILCETLDAMVDNGEAEAVVDAHGPSVRFIDTPPGAAQ